MSKTSTKKRKQTGAMGSKKTRRKNASKSLKESKVVQARKARDNIAEQYKSWDDKKPDQYVWEILYIREAFRCHDEFRYYIKWAGWEDLETWRWQRESLLVGSEDIVREFWEHIRLRERKRHLSIAAFKRTFHIGQMVVSSAAWIREQKKEYRMLHDGEDLPGALNPRQISPGPWEELEPSDNPLQYQWAEGAEALRQSGAEADMTIDSGSDSEPEPEPARRAVTTPRSPSPSNFASPASTITELDSDQDGFTPEESVSPDDADILSEIVKPEAPVSPTRLVQPLSPQLGINRSCTGSAAIPVLASKHRPRFPKLVEGPDPLSESVLTPLQYRLDVASKSKPLDTLSFVRSTRHGRPEGMFLENIPDKPTPSQGEAEAVKKSMTSAETNPTMFSRAQPLASHSWATDGNNDPPQFDPIFDDYDDFVPVPIEEKDWDAFDSPSLTTVAATSDSHQGWNTVATSSASAWDNELTTRPMDGPPPPAVIGEASAATSICVTQPAPPPSSCSQGWGTTVVSKPGGWGGLATNTTVTAGWSNVSSLTTQASSRWGVDSDLGARQNPSQHATSRAETTTAVGDVSTDPASVMFAGGGLDSSSSSSNGGASGWATVSAWPAGWNDLVVTKPSSEAATGLTNNNQLNAHLHSSPGVGPSLPEWGTASSTSASGWGTAAAPVVAGWGEEPANTIATGAWSVPAHTSVPNALGEQQQGSRRPTGYDTNTRTRGPYRELAFSKTPRHRDSGWSRGRSSNLPSRREVSRSARPAPTGSRADRGRGEQAHAACPPSALLSAPEATNPDEMEINALIADDAARLAAAMKQMAAVTLAPTGLSHGTALSLSVCPASPEAEEGEIVDEPLQSTQAIAVPTETEAQPTLVPAGMNKLTPTCPPDPSADMDSEDEVDAELDLDEDFVEALPDRI